MADPDIDGDGLPNGQDPNDFDTDSDNDGIEDGIDPAPSNSTTTLNLTITEKLSAYTPGEELIYYHDPENDPTNRAIMQCHIDGQIGDSESFDETWRLYADSGNFTIDGESAGSYDKTDRSISTSGADPKEVIYQGCNSVGDCVTQWAEVEFEWNATYHPGESPKITGSIDVTETWTWDLNSEESVCHYTLSFTAD